MYIEKMLKKYEIDDIASIVIESDPFFGKINVD